MVKDVAKIYIIRLAEDEYSASGDYSLSGMYGCMERALFRVWFDSAVNSTTQSYDKTSEAKRLVALCVPIGADADGNEVIGDLYAVFWDKDKGIVTDPSVLFPDAPKSQKRNNGND